MLILLRCYSHENRDRTAPMRTSEYWCSRSQKHRVAFSTPCRLLPCILTNDSIIHTPKACISTTQKPKTVGIAGAGIAGLTTALSLLKTADTGVEHVSIFEARKSLDSGLGGLLNINGGAAVLAKSYNIDLWGIGNQTNQVLARDSKGSLLFQVDVPKQLDSTPDSKKLLSKNGRHLFMSVKRDSLQELLYNAVKSEAVTFHFGQEWEVVDVILEGTQACFVFPDSKTSDYFDLVIGADGIRSNVRKFVTGSLMPPVYSGIHVQWAIAPEGNCSLKENHLEQWFGNGGYVLRYAAGPKESLTEALALSFREVQQSTENVTYRTEDYVKGDMKKRLNNCDMPETILNVFGRCTKFIETSVYYHSSISSWSRGGVCTLVGDSAHAMVPFLGQGANQAIQDAHALALALANIGITTTGISEALQEYESLRSGPTTALMQGSRILGLLETQEGFVGKSMRDILFRFVGLTGAAGQTFVQSATPRIPL